MTAPIHRRHPVALAASLLLALPLGALAQDTPQRVDVIGVAPVPGLDLPRDRVPAHVQSARSDALERSGAADLAGFLTRRFGSVHVNEVQGNPFQPELNYRGFTASPLLGTAQGLSVYVDGVRLNQPFGDVVSWDLLPKSAIDTVTLMPGSNPLFGLNTLGGAVSVQTKDGLRHPGHAVQLLAGSQGRVALEWQSGGGAAEGWNWFATGQRLHERGWRTASPSDLAQLFGKLGWRSGRSTLSLSAAAAENELTGNGLQEARLLARDWASIYTQPDTTRNRAQQLNLLGSHQFSDTLSLSGNAYWRRLHTRTLNGDLNDDALDQAVYQPNAAERAALAAAGYSGYPASGENAGNTPFPKWRCIAQALLVDEPAEKCNGLLNRSSTDQTQWGASLQLNWDGQLGRLRHQALVGVGYEASRVHFVQGSELGYLNPDRSVTGVGAFGDGVTGGDVDGAPYDTRVDLSARTRTWSVYASDTVALAPQTYLTASARYNRSTVRNRDAITPGGGTGSLDGDHVFSRVNPALGLTMGFGRQLSAYAGVSQGSRAPSAVELGCADPASPCKLPNAMAGDPPLRQVVTTTVETGLRGQHGGVAWNLGLFRSDNRDDILFVADNAAGYGYFRNFGKTRRQGLEAGLSTPLAGATVGLNYTWLDATFRSAEVLGGAGNSSNDQAQAGFPGTEGTVTVQPGHRIPLLPRQLLKLYAEAPVGGGWSLSADVVGVGGSLARGNENNAHQADGLYYLGSGRSAGYAVLNLGAQWRPARALTVFVQLHNAFDRRYTTAAQLGTTGFDANGAFVARPFAANANGDRPLVGSTFYAPGAPRAAWLGLRYTFGG